MRGVTPAGRPREDPDSGQGPGRKPVTEVVGGERRCEALRVNGTEPTLYRQEREGPTRTPGGSQ